MSNCEKSFGWRAERRRVGWACRRVLAEELPSLRMPTGTHSPVTSAALLLPGRAQVSSAAPTGRPARQQGGNLPNLQLLCSGRKKTPAGATNITWNERSKQVKSMSPTEDTKPPFPEGEEVPAFSSAKAKLKLPVDVKGQQFPLHPCHVQVTRHALRASRLVRTIHLIASNALNLNIRKQTLGISRT